MKISYVTAYPSVERNGNISVITPRDPKLDVVRINASKEDGLYTIEDFINGLKEVIESIK